MYVVAKKKNSHVPVVTPLTLGEDGIFALLVLRHLVGGVLLAGLTLAVGVPGFRDVDL